MHKIHCKICEKEIKQIDHASQRNMVCVFCNDDDEISYDDMMPVDRLAFNRDEILMRKIEILEHEIELLKRSQK